MRRRDVVATLGAIFAWPGAARTQHRSTPAIGFLGSAAAAGFQPQTEAFRKGLADAGFIVGSNVRIEYRWADDHYERQPALAAELVEQRVALILASGQTAALAAKDATASIPVVFVVGFDPVDAGLVRSLSQPGGNLTGIYLYIAGLLAKKTELLSEMIPDVADISVLVNPGTPSAKLDAAELESSGGARRNGRWSILNASTLADIDKVFAELADRKAAAVIGTDTFYIAHREHIAAIASARRVPTIYYAREFVTAGGLMSYGANIPEIYRQSATYAARILKGEKPADMPVQQPTKFELAINLKTAKALGLAVPVTLLSRADEVIE